MNLNIDDALLFGLHGHLSVPVEESQLLGDALGVGVILGLLLVAKLRGFGLPAVVTHQVDHLHQ